MGCIKIEAYSELDFAPRLFGKCLLGYIGNGEQEQEKLIDVQEIVSYEWAPILRVNPAAKNDCTNTAVNGLRVLLKSGDTVVSPYHSFEAFEQTVDMARKPGSKLVIAKPMSEIELSKPLKMPKSIFDKCSSEEVELANRETYDF